MKKVLALLLIISSFLFCEQTKKADLYTIGIFQFNDSTHLNDVRNGFIQAMEDNGFINGKNIRFLIKNGKGDIPEVQRIALEFVRDEVDMIVPFSTPCVRAALHATRQIPILFSSVANPFLAGAGISAEDHLSNVTGVSSAGPIKQSLALIKDIIPHARRIGTLWTPSEINSNYYLEVARDSAAELGLDIVAVPIANSSEILLSAHVLINEKIDVIYQISDNTINDSFEAVGLAAAENSIPLFGGFLSSTQLGACASMGWDFFDMGYRTGKIALQIKNGEKPSDIPFQHMDNVLLHINLDTANKQGVEFPDEILKRADKIISEDSSSNNL